MLLSLGTTVLATSLIIYRIYIVSKDSGNGSDRYNFTMEVLAESGAMYAATLLVVCVFLITPGTTFNAAPSNISFWVGVVTPMAVSLRCVTPELMDFDFPDICTHRESLPHL